MVKEGESDWVFVVLQDICWYLDDSAKCSSLGPVTNNEVPSLLVAAERSLGAGAVRARPCTY